MYLKDFMDLDKLQKIQDMFSNATGLAAIAVDQDGNYITEGSNFTDFCMKYTRRSPEGNRRCVKCDNECKGVYYCHAGLMDFASDIIVNGEKVGAIIGGQVLPKEPDIAEFEHIADELGISKEAYMENKAHESIESVSNEIESLKLDVKSISDKTKELETIASRQNMLTLNASIEAARSGDAGVGFAVVAKQMGDLSKHSAAIYKGIKEVSNNISDSIKHLGDTLE